MNSNGNTAYSEEVVMFPSTPPTARLHSSYPTLLTPVSTSISRGQRRANLAINQELISTYWRSGHDNLERQPEQGWGAKGIDGLSADLKNGNPVTKAFSPRNLKYMRSFAEVWSSEAIVQQPVAQFPWGYNLGLLDKLDDESPRLWYARMALSEGWSRNDLVRQIETRLHERIGQEISNFSTVLPTSTSAIIQVATKDPYVFDFLELTEAYNERELEGQLLQYVECFLLELGRGFAFVGRQLRLDMAGDEFFPDLLFYCFVLRRFVVVDLKAGKFEPGYLGQLDMYMTAVDDLLAQPGDEPAIGLLLCKSKNSVVAEYALRGFSSPIGEAQCATEIKDSLPESISRSLRSIDELEAELANAATTSPYDSSLRD